MFYSSLTATLFGQTAATVALIASSSGVLAPAQQHLAY